VLALYDATQAPDDPDSILLYYQESMSRTSSGGIFFTSNNDVIIYQIRIKQKTLVISSSTKENLGSSQYRVSEITENSKTLLSIPFQISQKIETCKLFKISKLLPLAVSPNPSQTSLMRQF